MPNKPAGFLLRLLAALTDGVFCFLIWSIGFYLIVNSSNTTNVLLVNTLTYFAYLVFPLLFITTFLEILAVSHLGGFVGKLLTGLRIVGENGKNLSFKRSFFRAVIAHPFAALLFGLGYFAIIKDPKKQGWHDKAVGSQVVVVQNLWPLALVVLVVLVALNYYLISTSIHLFSQSQLYDLHNAEFNI